MAILCIPWGCCVRLFPDQWFGVTAKFVGTPFVLVYRPLARFVDRVSEKLRFAKKDSDPEIAESEASSYSGKGKSPLQGARTSGDVEKGVLQ